MRAKPVQAAPMRETPAEGEQPRRPGGDRKRCRGARSPPSPRPPPRLRSRSAPTRPAVSSSSPSQAYTLYWNGDVRWATPTDVTGLRGRVISETASTITDAGLAHSSASLLPPYSLLMTTRATIGACAINMIAMATNQGFQNLVPKKNTCVYFLYYLIQHHRRRLERLAAGSTFLEVSKRAICGLRVAAPSESEQREVFV